jgi:hypothetical protein
MQRRVIFQARNGDNVKLGHITYDLMRYCSYEYEEHYMNEETYKRVIKNYIRLWFGTDEIIDISIVSLDDFWMADLDLVYDYVISEPDRTYYVLGSNKRGDVDAKELFEEYYDERCFNAVIEDYDADEENNVEDVTTEFYIKKFNDATKKVKFWNYMMAREISVEIRNIYKLKLATQLIRQFRYLNGRPEQFPRLYIFYEIKDEHFKLITKNKKRWGEFCVMDGEICGELPNIDYDVGIEALTYVIKNLERL